MSVSAFVTFDMDMAIRFDYHAPANDSVRLMHESVRAVMRNAAMQLKDVPECREKSLAITKLEEAMMWANAAIARHQGLVPLTSPSDLGV